MTMQRREFLRRAISAAAALGVVASGALPIMPGSHMAFGEDQKLPFKISLAEWSLHRALFGKSDFKLDPLEFASFAQKEFGISAVEYVNQFFKDKAENKEYLSEMKKRAEDAGVRSVLIMVDGEGLVGDPDEAGRQKSFENHKKWVNAAAFLGCHAIRVNAGSKGTWEEQVQYAADGLRKLTEYAEAQNLRVLVENHGGLSSNGKWLSEVMRTVDHPHCGTLPDFGNFKVSPTEMYDRYQGVSELMPFAMAVSAKSHDFDDQGNETATDFHRMLKIVTDAGYHSYVGIEYEGSRLSEVEGIRQTLNLLKRVQQELAS